MTPAERIRRRAAELGAAACGIAPAGPVSPQQQRIFCSFVDEGRHGSMAYLERYRPQRLDPRLLLPGARTVVVCAFSYYPGPLPPMPLKIAAYALGMDYHRVMGERMRQLAAFITAELGGECLVAVDTKPLLERYWAQQAGVGFVARNGLLCVPGAGTYCFIAALLWTGECEYSAPSHDQCLQCGACARACPNGALRPDGSCDARRCVSYLTIEHRGPAELPTAGWTYGCDICQRVCPLNRGLSPSPVADFMPRPEMLTLTADSVLAMGSGAYRRLTAASAMSRVPLKKLKLNVAAATAAPLPFPEA